MNLTLELLDGLAAVHQPWSRLPDFTSGPVTVCPAHDPSEPWPCSTSFLIDYARERAARERCEALLSDPEDVLWCDQVHGAPDGYRYIATVVRYKGGPNPSAYGPTPYEAYLALAAALVPR